MGFGAQLSRALCQAPQARWWVRFRVVDRIVFVHVVACDHYKSTWWHVQDSIIMGVAPLMFLSSCWEAVIDLAFWRSGGSGVPADLAGPPIWLPIWRRSGGGRSGENLAVLATAPFWRRLVRKGRNADPKVTPKGDRISVPSRGF